MQLGKKNILNITAITDTGYLLEDADSKDILLPLTESVDQLNVGDSLEVFVFRDNKNRLTATTRTATVSYEQFAYLKVKDINKVGAFMDWGIPKDLLVPYAEQTEEMVVGNRYLIFMLLDEETNRLIGSCKENEFILFDTDRIKLEIGDKVDLLLFNKTELGINAIVNNMYKGLIFNSDIHKDIKPGDQLKGYVKKVRDDGHIDLLLEPLGYKKSIDPTTQTILSALSENNECLYLTDKSSPEAIKKQLGLSKKAFKRGLGNLYKQKKITILDDCIRLV